MASAAETALERLSRVERPARLIGEFALIIAVAILIARIVWLVAAPYHSVADYADRPLPSPMQSDSSAVAISIDRTRLLDTNPFGLEVTDAPVEDVPETSLNLQLIGLRMSTDEEESGNAIIRSPNGIAKNYGVGDEVLAGVTLERILSDRAIINRDGASETLMLGGRGAGLSVITDDSQTLPPEALSVSPREAEAAAVSESVSEARFAGPEVFLGAVSATRETVDGALVGYRLMPINGSTVMQDAGLQPGDLLRAIDGVSVLDLDAADLIDRLAQIETAEIDIIRDGSNQTIRLVFGD